VRKQSVVPLPEEERAHLHTRSGSGTAPARTLTHARSLRKAHRGAAGPGWTDPVIADALDVGHATGARVRHADGTDGVTAARARTAPHRTYHRKLDGEQDAHWVALAGSAPPAGRQRWPLRLLAAHLVHREVGDELSHDTVRQPLQPTKASRG
jgi:hypothetical protein